VENRACGTLKALPSPISACKMKLQVQGFRLDTVAHVDTVKDLTAAETTPFVGHLLELSSMINARRQGGSLDQLVLQEVTIPDQLLLTICHKFEGLVESTEDLNKIRPGMRVLHRLAVYLSQNGHGDYPLFLLRDIENFKELDESVRLVIFNIIWAMTGKCFILTEKGYVGLIQASRTEVDDEIWILFGCSMPVVLRQEGDHYIFVTPVSMSGFMKGEAVEGIPDDVQDGDRYGDYELRTIELD